MVLWLHGIRRTEGMNLKQALSCNCGTHSLDVNRKVTSVSTHTKAKVEKQGSGSDPFIVVKKAGNAAGAKGWT